MANATIESKTETVVVTESQTVQVYVYTLTLTPEEAQTLADLTAMCGGDPKNSRRKHTEAVYEALASAGVSYLESPYRCDKRGGLKDLIVEGQYGFSSLRFVCTPAE